MLQNTNDYKKYIYYFLRSVVFVINLILNIFCLFLFVVSICRIYWGPEKILDIFRIDYYKVASGSMEPLIKKEDIVVVKKIPDKEKENIGIGDIVIFQNKDMTDGIPIIHRVVSNNTKLKTIRTKGDNNQIVDPFYTDYDGILAKHIFTISYFKTFLCFFFLILFIFSNMPFLLKNLFLSSKKKNNLYK